jgi:hypothetical protein
MGHSVQREATAIAGVIRRFSEASSSRGIWRVERDLAEQLGGRRCDVQAAAAARTLGEWLREYGNREVRR